MRILLKRYKGGIGYSDFYEMYDDDCFSLYRREIEDIERENKEFEDNNKGNGGTRNPKAKPVNEPKPAPESPEMLNYMEGLFDDDDD